MRILIFSHEYPPCLGGAGTIADLLHKSLSSEYSCKVDILTSRRTKSSFERRIFTPILSRKLWFFSYLPWLIKNEKKYDFFILNDPAAIYSAGKVLSDSTLKKSICIVHGMEKHLTSSNHILDLINFSSCFKRALNNSKNTVFVSNFIKDQYKNIYNIRPKNTTVIHSGAKEIFFNKPIKSKDKDKINFLTVSRIVKEKGYDRMLSIFENLHTIGINFSWTIVGDGNYKNEFEEKILDSPISDKIQFMGKQPQDVLSNIYPEHDIYILLSELAESFGLSYLEASASGLVPIGYNATGVKEAFQYIQNGFLIERSASDYELAREIYNIAKINLTSSCLRHETDFSQEIIKMIKS